VIRIPTYAGRCRKSLVATFAATTTKHTQYPTIILSDNSTYHTIKDFSQIIAANHGEIGDALRIVGRLMHQRHGRNIFVSVEVDFLLCSKGSLGVEGRRSIAVRNTWNYYAALWGNDHWASCRYMVAATKI